MSELKIYCLSIHDRLLNKIKDLNYIPVGLGQFNFSNGWLRDNTNENISIKNKYYGEYTFHYWFWKNLLQHIEGDKWIGFCAQRRFWSKNKVKSNINNFHDLKKNIIQSAPEEWDNYDVIIGDEINISNISWTKIVKYGKLALIRNPESIYRKRRNIRFQFDMFHGCGILDKAINLLPKEDRNDFNYFVRNKQTYNQGNMFICKSKSIMHKYYTSIFEWLVKCEKIFGFNLEGYGKQRIYAFLAERYLPFWFSKYTKKLDWPVVFYNLMENE